MFERVHRMLVKEFIQVLRDPKMKGLLFAMPVIQLLVFGYAVTTDVRHVATAVYDLDNSVASRDLVAQFVHSGYFDVVETVRDEPAVRDLLDRGVVCAVFRMNDGFGRDLAAGRTAQLQVLVDGTDSNTARIVLDYSSRIAARFSQAIFVSEVTRRFGAIRKPGQLVMQTRAWFNEDLESRNFYVPGVIAQIVLVVSVALTSMAVVREKEIGTMEQILVTPIRPAEFILGKTVPFFLIAMADVVLVAAAGVLWFDVPIRGNPLILLFSAALYLMTTIGAGLLISTVCQTQQQAMMSGFFFIFPVTLLSGFMFPIANMPAVIQWLTYLNPLRYFLIIIRGIFLKGVGLDVLWPQMAALAALGTVALVLAARRFHKTLS